MATVTLTIGGQNVTVDLPNATAQDISRTLNKFYDIAKLGPNGASNVEKATAVLTWMLRAIQRTARNKSYEERNILYEQQAKAESDAEFNIIIET